MWHLGPHVLPKFAARCIVSAQKGHTFVVQMFSTMLCASLLTADMQPSCVGKRSGDKSAAPEDIETKHEFVPTTTAPLEAQVSGSAAPSSAAVRETHNSNTLGMAAAPAMAPILPAQAPLPHDTAQLPPVLIAALNQINQGQAQQGLPAIESLQSLLQPSTDHPVQQPPLFQHPQS
jgi:uncharacterized protein YkwD